MPLRRECPVCGASRARPVWHEDGFRYVRCSRCRAVFSDVDALTYDSAASNTWHEDKVAPATHSFYGAARGLVQMRFLERFPPTGSGRLLDVGCGLGYFVSRATAAGWDAYGCDTSEPWIRHARSVVGEGRVALGSVTANVLGGRFDLVTAWDVLEHIYDPLPFLRSIGESLAPDGRLFIRTPNLTWIYPTYATRRHVLSSVVELGPTNHVVYYTAATLRRALEGAGFRAAEWLVLPPPQVGFANRDPSQAGRATAVIRAKNLHAVLADRLATASRNRVVAGADLDVMAVLMAR